MIIEKNLYEKIQGIIPIACVDLIIVNEAGKVLLARRTNQPAQGEWWFPGGRVHYLETRVSAAVRKLKEECSLKATQMGELGTFDVILDGVGDRSKLHFITTVFIASVGSTDAFILEEQNSTAEWRLPADWLKLTLDPFVEQALTIFSENHLNIKDEL